MQNFRQAIVYFKRIIFNKIARKSFRSSCLVFAKLEWSYMVLCGPDQPTDRPTVRPDETFAAAVCVYVQKVIVILSVVLNLLGCPDDPFGAARIAACFMTRKPHKLTETGCLALKLMHVN